MSILCTPDANEKMHIYLWTEQIAHFDHSLKVNKMYFSSSFMFNTIETPWNLWKSIFIVYLAIRRFHLLNKRLKDYNVHTTWNCLGVLLIFNSVLLIYLLKHCILILKIFQSQFNLLFCFFFQFQSNLFEKLIKLLQKLYPYKDRIGRYFSTTECVLIRTLFTPIY